VDPTRAQQSTRRVPVRYQSLTEEDILNEDDVDEVWPPRLASSARRYQHQADVRTESGRVADVEAQPERRGYGRAERQTPPVRRAATRARAPAVEEIPPRVSLDEKNVRRSGAHRPSTRSARGQRRFHWLVFVGLALFVMILGWLTLSAAGSWWQTTQDDWRYGRPRTFQIDQVVGHHDSPQNPSHFIAMNLNRHILVIEIPGGDVSKSVLFSGPTLLGPGQDLTPVTLSFQDIDHDGKPDMIVSLQGNQFVYLNENGTFVPASQNSGTSG
jgi:hypothetical protein